MARTARVNKKPLVPVPTVILPPEPDEPPSFDDKVRMGYYTTKLPYGERHSPERAAHNDENSRLYDEFRRDVAIDAGTDDLPQEVRDALFAKAWDDGHAYGYSEVSICYWSLSQLVLLAFKAGVQSR